MFLETDRIREFEKIYWVIVFIEEKNNEEKDKN